ncbi:hypothetical protein GCM10012275_56270 [Longimycelium tulufanense]|uniref:Prohead serine protease domain-containing protein n=1 Tax=Longimycelium tulufanense TaxID=907463 RepID=A0A8J3CDP2_9PSEU|nr:HK97 family phage prohead protease [Longimycelium tulufanense]GGM78404.1 hypothetical protein GCM10012275_56270 [Longimycelium tulufanense]
MNLESRSVDVPVEWAERDDGGLTLVGYAWVYDSWSHDLGGFVERIEPTARWEPWNGDVIAAFNHSADQLLGRLSSGTLRLSTDTRGGRYEIDLPNTNAGRDVAELLRRGDLRGSSFRFATPSGGDSWEERDGHLERTLHRFTVMDVGPVTTPAYPDTEAALRSLAHFRAQHAPPAGPAPRRHRRILGVA